MIKKTGILTLTLLYLITVMGVALNFHYCFGQVTSVKIAHPARTCGSLKIKRVPACCKTKYSRGPPECLPDKQPLFLLNRTFRI